MKGGVAVGQGSQFVEHHGDVAHHVDLVSLGVIGFSPRLLQLILYLSALRRRFPTRWCVFGHRSHTKRPDGQNASSNFPAVSAART
jgi:hypothetical protein